MSGPTANQQAQKVDKKPSAGQEIAEAHAAFNPNSQRIDANSSEVEQLRSVAEFVVTTIADKTSRALSNDGSTLNAEFPQTRASDLMCSVLVLPVVTELEGEQRPRGFLLPAYHELHRDDTERSRHTGEVKAARESVGTIHRLHSDKFKILSADAMIGFAFSSSPELNTLGVITDYFPVTVLFSSQAFKEAIGFACSNFRELAPPSDVAPIDNEDLAIQALKLNSARRIAQPREQKQGVSLEYFSENADDYLSGFVSHEIAKQICLESAEGFHSPSARILRVSELDSALSVVVQFSAQKDKLGTLTISCSEPDHRLKCEWTS